MGDVKKGFTLVELLVVVAILGVLAAVGIVSFGGYLGSAKENATKSNFNSIMKYIETELYKCDMGLKTEAYSNYLIDSGTYHSLSNGDCTNTFEKISWSILQYIHQYDNKGFSNPINTNNLTSIHIGNYCTGQHAYNLDQPNMWGNVSCYHNYSDDTLICCTSWGEGVENRIVKIFQNPYE